MVVLLTLSATRSQMEVLARSWDLAAGQVGQKGLRLSHMASHRRMILRPFSIVELTISGAHPVLEDVLHSLLRRAFTSSWLPIPCRNISSVPFNLLMLEGIMRS